MLVMTLVKVSFRALYDVCGGFRSRYRAREDLYNKQLAFSSGRHPESRCAESKKSSLQPQIPVWLHVEDYNGDLINTLPIPQVYHRNSTKRFLLSRQDPTRTESRASDTNNTS